MLTVPDATKVVKLPYRPLCFKPIEGKEVTGADIRDWLKKEEPGTIQCLPNFAVWTAIGTVVSTVLGFVGIKQDSKLCKWIGGILGLVGIASTGFGVYLARIISQFPEKEKKAKEEQEKIHFETPIINSLKNISREDENKREEERKKLIIKHAENSDKVKELLERIKSSNNNDDKNLSKEAELCLKIIHDAEKESNSAIAILNNKSANKDDRYRAISELRSCLVRGNKAVIEALSSRVKDKSDRPHGIREESMLSLVQIQGYGAKELLFNMLQDPNEVLRSSVASTIEDLIRETKIEDKDCLKALLEDLNNLQINENDNEGKELVRSLITKIG